MSYTEKTSKSFEVHFIFCLSTLVPLWIAGGSPPLKQKSLICKLVTIICTSDSLLRITASRSGDYHQCYCLPYFTIWRKILYSILESMGIMSVKAWVLALAHGSYYCLILHISLVLCDQAFRLEK